MQNELTTGNSREIQCLWRETSKDGSIRNRKYANSMWNITKFNEQKKLVWHKVGCTSDAQEEVFFIANNFILQRNYHHTSTTWMRKCQYISICHPLTLPMTRMQNVLPWTSRQWKDASDCNADIAGRQHVCTVTSDTEFRNYAKGAAACGSNNQVWN
jgi:hypothetical protein